MRTLTCVWLGMTLCLGSMASDTQQWSAVDIAAVRKAAQAVFGTIPAKMPGSEKDTPERVELGKKLFFDKRLSANETMSCNTCHHVDQGGAGVDREQTSAGAFGKRGERNAPTVYNAGFHVAQFWDGRAPTLEEQAKGPILNPVEMAMPSAGDVIKRIAGDPEYQKLFTKAFPDSEGKITYDNVGAAIAAYERTLKTHDRFDDFLKGDNKALTPAELSGLDLFMKTGCTACHSGPLVGAQSFQKMGLAKPYENTIDLGRYGVTKDEADKYRFKVPSLRNVAQTVPYFHDGAVASLEEAVKKMSTVQLGKDLTLEQAQLISGFLRALSGKELIVEEPPQKP